MRRRSFLAAAGGTLLTLGGCLGANGSDTAPPASNETTEPPASDPTTEPPASDPTTETTTDQDKINPTLVSIQRGLVRLTYPDAASVLAEDTRYVVVAESTSGLDSPPARDEFGLRFDGTTYAPEKPDSAHEYRRLGPFYTHDSPGGQLLFALPTSGDPSDAAVTWPGGEWPLPEAVRQRLAAAPEFSVAIEGPEAGPSFTLAVTNEGERPQRFLAAVNLSGPSYAPAGTPSTVVDGGATERLTVSIPGPYAEELTERPDGETPSGRVTFDWIGGEAEREFPLG